MHLIVGLGNPGEKYEHTRHNAGFDALSILADRLGVKTAKLKGNETLAAKVTLEIPALGVRVPFDGEIKLQ